MIQLMLERTYLTLTKKTGDMVSTKPKYNTWQNSIYMIKGAWARDKFVVFTMAAQSLLTTAIPVVAMFLPSTVISLIMRNAGIYSLMVTVLVFTAATVFMQAAKCYLIEASDTRRTWLRMMICEDILFKVMTTDYANLEKKEFTDDKQKSHETTSGNHTVTERIYYTLENLGANLLGFVLYSILFININPLVLLLTATTTILGFFIRRWANKWQFANENENANYGKRTWYITNLGKDTTVTKDIWAYQMFGWLNDVYNSYMKLRNNWHRRLLTRQYIADVADCIMAFLREGAVYAYLIWQILFNEMTVEQFVLLFAAIGGFSSWIMGILNEYSVLHRNSLDICRLREFLDFPNAFKRGDGEPILPGSYGKTYSLELKNVSFRYPGASEDSLTNVNLKIKQGEKLAVVGLNGAGKTTVVKLLCGFYDPTEGSVLLDGKDIRAYDRTEYYKLFTAVFQEFNILPVSLAENVAQEYKDELDLERVKNCLALADLTEKVDSLPESLDSLLIKDVHEEAVEFSGGETQRLMLARALYKDSPILVLDEPTAALDPIAERRLYERYNELAAEKTSVYISHRLASTSFCDRIIFIDNKTITETGTHEQLLSYGGRYAELFEIQSKYYREGAEK